MMAAIKSHLSMAELEGRYETAADPISKSHFHGLWLLSKGLEIEEVAELLSFSTRWVYQLVKRYNEGGPDCLGDQARIKDILSIPNTSYGTTIDTIERNTGDKLR